MAVSREALLVLGMHRSGTSSVAGLIVRLGVQGPATLMPADASNPEGYWESTVFCDLHERLLRAAGSRWDSCTRVDLDRLEPSISSDLVEECRRALRSEFGDGPRFVLKDPRICRFVPFWLRLLQREGIVPTAVLVLRNPFEVARSLEAKSGFDQDLSLLLWLRHVLDAEFHTRGIRRTFVRYQDLVRDWRSVAEQVSRDLGTSWHARTADDEVEIDRFVNARLRHHCDELDTQTGLAPVLAEWLRRSWVAVQRLRDGDSGDAAVLAALDAVRLEFDRASSAVGEVGDRIRAGLEAQLESVEREQHARRQQVMALEGVRAELQARVVGLEQHVGALERHSETLQRHLQAVEQNIQAVEQDRETLQQELFNAHQDARALRESVSWRITAPLRAAYRLLR